MADMSGIYSFSNSDGLSPQLVAKMNHNLWEIVQKIAVGDVVMAAGSTLPDPRIDETLFYNKDTGDLYIWRKYNNEWGWGKVDTGYIHVDNAAPQNSSYQRENEVIWIDKSNNLNNPLYLWVGNSDEGYAWMNIKTLVKDWFIPQITRNEWLGMTGFVAAVKAIHNNPNNY